MRPMPCPCSMCTAAAACEARGERARAHAYRLLCTEPRRQRPAPPYTREAAADAVLAELTSLTTPEGEAR